MWNVLTENLYSSLLFFLTHLGKKDLKNGLTGQLQHYKYLFFMPEADIEKNTAFILNIH